VLKNIEGFQWDLGNSHKNEAHGVRQFEAEQVFFNAPLLTLADINHSQSEPRYTAMGLSDSGRLLHVTFTLRQAATLIRIISARDMHRKEKAFYGEKTKTDS
jgi:uncharacterized DUF497 family protein